MGTMKNQGVPSETPACFVVGKAATDNISNRLCCLSCENPNLRCIPMHSEVGGTAALGEVLIK